MDVVRGLVVVEQGSKTLVGRMIGDRVCGNELNWGAAQVRRLRDAQMLENGRGQIRELHQPWLSGRARLECSSSEVRSGDGNHSQAFGGSRVGEAGQHDIRPGRCDLEYSGNPGVDDRDLLGPRGRWSYLIPGVHIGRIADWADVDQRHGAGGQS